MEVGKQGTKQHAGQRGSAQNQVLRYG